MLDIDDVAPTGRYSRDERLVLVASELADAAVYAFASDRGYLGSMSPTIAAIIANPIRKSWISVGAPIDCLLHPCVISGLG